jgi:hypothetical protein
LQLDEADDFFRHAFLLAGCDAWDREVLGSPGLTTQDQKPLPSREAPVRKKLKNQVRKLSLKLMAELTTKPPALRLKPGQMF